MKSKRKLRVGCEYPISFIDHRQDIYTWFVGEGVFVKKDREDYGTDEQHYYFMVDGNECSFPESSIGRLLR